MTKSNLYACAKSRSLPSHWMQDGWEQDSAGKPLTPKFIAVEFRNSKDCRYDRAGTDPRCSPCPRNPTTIHKDPAQHDINP